MSPARWITSALILWHVAALLLASIPAPGDLPRVASPRHPTEDVIAAQVTPPLDSIARATAGVPDFAWNATGHVRVAANKYLSVMAVTRRWNMFWLPTKDDEYMRVRYYVASKDAVSAAWTSTELIFPGHREDEVRFLSSYTVKHSDRAIDTAFGSFRRGLSEDMLRPDVRSEELPDDLAPIVRYFRRRFAQTYLNEGERIVRSEIWYGSVPVPPRGTIPDTAAVDERSAALSGYYAGPVTGAVSRSDYPPFHSLEYEADIRWVLEYFE